mgnify:CR=1 FL=1
MQDDLKVFKYREIFSGFDSELSVQLGDFSVIGDSLIVLPKLLVRRRLRELNDVGELSGVFLLIVLQTDQRRLHDVDAGHIFGDREAIEIVAA